MIAKALVETRPQSRAVDTRHSGLSNRTIGPRAGRGNRYDNPAPIRLGPRLDLNNIGTASFCSASPKSMRWIGRSPACTLRPPCAWLLRKSSMRTPTTSCPGSFCARCGARPPHSCRCRYGRRVLAHPHSTLLSRVMALAAGAAGCIACPIPEMLSQGVHVGRCGAFGSP